MIDHLMIIMDLIVEQKHGKMLMARGESIGNVINLSKQHSNYINLLLNHIFGENFSNFQFAFQLSLIPETASLILLNIIL